MLHHPQSLRVEIDIPSGAVFRGFSRAVAISANEHVVIELRRNWLNYISLSEHAEVTVEMGTCCRRFVLKNAMARLDPKKLSILAEAVTPSDVPPPEQHDAYAN